MAITAILVADQSTFGQAPMISLHPRNETVAATYEVILNATASGGQPLIYQWWRGAEIIPDATNAVFMIANVQGSHAGDYSLMVTNVFGGTASSNAVVSVIPPYGFTTFAGTPGASGSTDATGAAARFWGPHGVAMDSSGNLYVADTINSTVRRMTPAGAVTTFAGTAVQFGSTDATGAAAKFNSPYGIAVDAMGNVFVADTYNHTIRKITPARVVTTLAGSAGQIGSTNGTGSAARFNHPYGVAVDGSGNVFVADTGNHIIRKITPARVVTTLAGLAGQIGSSNGTGSTARFNSPYGIAINSSNILYVTDRGNHTIRTVTQAGVTTTFAGIAGNAGHVDGIGTAALLNNPEPIAVDNSNEIYVVDSSSFRKITPSGVVATTAGGTAGYVDAIGSAVTFQAPGGIAVDGSGVVYVSDNPNEGTIRKGGSAPLITTQPASRAVTTGSNVSFSVIATSRTPLSYQWRKNSMNISGATGSSYVRNNVQTGDVGIYSVVVGNPFGNVASFDALLEVFTPPTFFAQPQNQTVVAGNNAVFSAGVNGSAPISFQWSKDGLNISGATYIPYYRTNVQSADGGDYTLVITNRGGSATSTVARLTVIVPARITSQPESSIAVVGSSVSFSVTASGTLPLTYQWRRNAVNIFGATSSSYIRTNVQSSDAGNYSVVVANSGGAVISSNAILTVVVPPTIGAQPQGRVVNLGASVTFSVSASGTAPLFYQWRWNGQNIPGATNSSYVLATTETNHAGIYSLLITNIAGAVTSSNAQLDFNVPPSISKHPKSQGSSIGDAVSFTVVASGTAPLNYQWTKDGININGATNNEYVNLNVQANDAGIYSVAVTNIAGKLTSSNAMLTVNVPPTVITEPQSRSIPVGSIVIFNVIATGTTPLGFQWKKDGNNIAGATGGFFTISNARSMDAGTYTVLITNAVGETVSSNAVLSVFETTETANLALTEPRKSTDGAYRFNVAAVAGNNVVVEGAHNISYWDSLKTNTAPANGTLHFFDSSTANYFQYQRYFRARLLGEIPLGVTISPNRIVLLTNQAQQFKYQVLGTTNDSVIWSVNNVVGGNSEFGTVSSNGLFFAPTSQPNPNTVNLRVTSGADTNRFASAAVTVQSNYPATLAITSLNKASLQPFESLTILGTGFEPLNSAISVLLIPSAGGIPVAVPAYDIRTNSVKIIVPPVLHKTNGLSSGPVGVQVVQFSGQFFMASGVQSGLSVSALPFIPANVQTGAITKAYLIGALNVADTIKSSSISNMDLIELAADLDPFKSDLDSVLSAIETILTQPHQTVTLPTLNDTPFILDLATLENIDRLILGSVQQFLAQVQPPTNGASTIFSQHEKNRLLPLKSSSCPQLYGDPFTDRMLCDRQRYGQELASKGSEAVRLGASIEFGFYITFFGGWAASGFAEAGVVANSMAKAFQVLWSGASSYIASYVTARPQPDLPSVFLDVGPQALDTYATRGLPLLSWPVSAYKIYADAAKIVDGSAAQAPQQGLVVTGPAQGAAENSSAIVSYQVSSGDAETLGNTLRFDRVAASRVSQSGFISSVSLPFSPNVLPSCNECFRQWSQRSAQCYANYDAQAAACEQIVDLQARAACVNAAIANYLDCLDANSAQLDECNRSCAP
jgi:sugar lactone lactonase YvrE